MCLMSSKYSNLKIGPPEVEYSILIKDDLQVEAHHRCMKIANTRFDQWFYKHPM